MGNSISIILPKRAGERENSQENDRIVTEVMKTLDVEELRAKIKPSKFMTMSAQEFKDFGERRVCGVSASDSAAALIAAQLS